MPVQHVVDDDDEGRFDRWYFDADVDEEDDEDDEDEPAVVAPPPPALEVRIERSWDGGPTVAVAIAERDDGSWLVDAEGAAIGPFPTVVAALQHIVPIGADEVVEIDGELVSDVLLAQHLPVVPGDRAEVTINGWLWAFPAAPSDHAELAEGADPADGEPYPEGPSGHPEAVEVAGMGWSFEGRPAIGFGNEGWATLTRLGPWYFWSDGDGNVCDEAMGRLPSDDEALRRFILSNEADHLTLDLRVFSDDRQARARGRAFSLAHPLPDDDDEAEDLDHLDDPAELAEDGDRWELGADAHHWTPA